MHHARNTTLAAQQMNHLLKQKYALNETSPARARNREAGFAATGGGQNHLSQYNSTRRHASIDPAMLMPNRIKGNDIHKENARLYEKIAAINTRRPQIKMPFTYIKDLKIKPNMAYSMGGFNRRGKRLSHPAKYRQQVIRLNGGNRGAFQPAVDLTRPLLSQSKRDLLAENSSRVIDNTGAFASHGALIEEADKERKMNKLKQQFQNKLGSVTNSIQAAGDNAGENSAENQGADGTIEKDQKELAKTGQSDKQEGGATQNVFKANESQRQSQPEENDSEDDRLETPNILKSAKVKKDSAKSISDQQENKQEEHLNQFYKHQQPEMYTQTRFFDPELLSFRPLKYPNIQFLQNQNSQQNFQMTQYNQDYQSKSNIFGNNLGQNNQYNQSNQQLQQSIMSQKAFGNQQAPAHIQSNASFGPVNSPVILQNQAIQAPNAGSSRNLQQQMENNQLSQASINNRSPGFPQQATQSSRNLNHSFNHVSQANTDNAPKSLKAHAQNFKNKRNTLQNNQAGSGNFNTMNSGTSLAKNMQLNASSKQIMIFDDGKQSFSKISTTNLAPFKQPVTNTSYFTKDSSILAGSRSLLGKPEEAEKYLHRKRQLYKGIHEVPVFNLRLSSKPILLSFSFSVFRMNNNKRKIFVSAKLLTGQPRIGMMYVHTNANLLLELTEKAAQKYLLMSDNDFGRMIEDLIIVANSRLKIENVNMQQYRVSEVMNQGYYAYVDDDTNEEHQDQPLKSTLNGASTASFAKTNYYKNLKILPKHPGSRNTLTHQLSQATASGLGAGFGTSTMNMKSLKNQVFNVNSEQQIDEDFDGENYIDNGQNSQNHINQHELEQLQEQFEEEEGSSYAGMRQTSRQGTNQRQNHSDYMQQSMQQPQANTHMDPMKQMHDYHLPEITPNGPGAGGMTHMNNMNLNMTQPMPAMSQMMNASYPPMSMNMDPMGGDAPSDPMQSMQPMQGMMPPNSMFGGPVMMPNAVQNPMQMMGHTDGFTLVKGISSYGMNKMRKRANIDDSKISNFSDMTKTQTSQLGVTSGNEKNRRNKKDKMNHTVEPQLNSRHRIKYDHGHFNGQQVNEGGFLPAADNQQASSFYTQATAPANEDKKIMKASPYGDDRDPYRHHRNQEIEPPNDGSTFPKLKPQKKFLQTMGNFNSGLDANKINTTTEHFLKNKHGVHITEKIHTTMNNKRKKKLQHQQSGGDDEMENGDINMMAQKAPLDMGRPGFQQQLGYDSSSDSSYLHIPQFNAEKKLSKITPTSQGGAGHSPGHNMMQDNYLKGPSQQSFYFNGFPGPAENVSQTNRPHFDQISDATKYVLNPNHLVQTIQNNQSTQETMNVRQENMNDIQMQNPASVVTKPNQQTIIHEEDYQQSSRGHLGEGGQNPKQIHQNQDGDPTFQNTAGDRTGQAEDDEQGRPVQQFTMQKADFESRSEGTETASEGHQPSQYREHSMISASKNYQIGQSIKATAEASERGVMPPNQVAQQSRLSPHSHADTIAQVAQSNISFAGQFSNMISPENPFTQTTQQNMTLVNGGTGASNGSPGRQLAPIADIKQQYDANQPGAGGSGPLRSGPDPESSSDSDDDDSQFSDEKYEQLQLERQLQYQQQQLMNSQQQQFGQSQN